MKVAYIAEVRDSGGGRETLSFGSRADFLEWCDEMCESGKYKGIEIMLVVKMLEASVPCVLYSGLSKTEELDWDDLIAFLS